MRYEKVVPGRLKMREGWETAEGSRTLGDKPQPGVCRAWAMAYILPETDRKDVCCSGVACRLDSFDNSKAILKNNMKRQ